MNNVISDRRTKFEVELKENSLPSHKLKIYLENTPVLPSSTSASVTFVISFIRQVRDL